MDTNLNMQQLGVCNLCLGHSAVKSMLTHQPSDVTEELYSDMLLKCFGIDILAMDFGDTKRVICKMCVQKLKDSVAFKAMAQASLKTLEVAAHKVKKEEISVEFNDNSLDADEDFVWKDKDEVKKEEISVEFNDNSLNTDEDFVWEDKEGKHSNITQKAPEDLKELVKSISERRSLSVTNSILRENSLKLLSNSTIYVFQWHKSRYRCFCCKEPFTDMSSLREHTNSVHSLKDIEKAIILQHHRPVKVEISSLFCKLCSKPLDNLNSLKTHLTDIHHVEFGMPSDNLLVPFKIESDNLQCQLCFETFRLFPPLNIHMNKHYQNHVCDTCGSGYPNLMSLKSHKSRMHRPHYCKECTVEFSNRLEKRKHDVAVHNLKVERKYSLRCQYCGEKFFHQNNKVAHLVAKHGMIKPEYKCSFCDKVYITQSLCSTHIINSHRKERKLECNFCNMKFQTKAGLNCHKVKHTGEKNFSCTFCNNLYSTEKSMRRHMKKSHIDL